MDPIQRFLLTVAEAFLVIGLPILIAFGAQWLRHKAAEVKASLTSQQMELITGAASIAVRAAEQAGITGQLAGGGAAKKAFAIKAAQDYLDHLGVSINVDRLATVVESEVRTQFAGEQVPPDNAQTRSQLIDKAVQSAVLAAEQTGVKQMGVNLAVDVAHAKKQYAVNIAGKYLSDYGIKIDPALIDGLIEAQIMRFKVEAAGTK